MATIMIVDDEPATCRALVSMLAVAGHTAFAIHSGQQGIELLRTVSVDLVLLDMGLPDVDGYEVLAQLRRNPRTREQRIIVYSVIGEAVQADPRASHVERVFSKRVSVAELVAEVEAVIGAE